MITLEEAFAIEDPEGDRQSILRQLCLYETLCFTSSSRHERWFIKKKLLYHMMFGSDGLCEGVNTYLIG